MEKLKEALIQFADSNPTLFPHDGFNSYPSLIEQRFSQFFFDFQTPNHPPYAAMIHKAIRELNQKRGSNEESISNYIKQEFVDLPWAHTTLLKHHLEMLCDRKEISITHKKRYLLPGSDSDPISNSKSEKQLKRKHNSETGKKSGRHKKKRKKSKKKEKRLLDLQESEKQIDEVLQEQNQVFLPLLDDGENVTHNEFQELECLKIEGNNLIDVSIQEMEEDGVCENDKEQIEIEGKKKWKLKRKSKKRGKIGKKKEINEDTELQDSSEANLKENNEKIESELHEKNPQNEDIQIQDSSEANLKQNNEEIECELHEKNSQNEGIQIQDLSEENLKQNNEEIECELHEKNSQNKGKRVWTKSRIEKMLNMPKDVEYLSKEKQEAKKASSKVSTRMNEQRAKLRSFKKKKGKANEKEQKKHKTCGKHKMTRRSTKKKAPS